MSALLVALFACGPGTTTVGDVPGHDSAEPDDSGDTGDTDTGADTGDTDSGETGAPVDPIGTTAVTLHPEVSTVLVVSWDQRVDAEATWLSWELDGEAWTSPVRARATGDVSELVLGVPPDTAVPVSLHVVVNGVETVEDLGEPTTGELPTDLFQGVLEVWDPTLSTSEPFFLTSVNVGPWNFYGPCYVVVVDRQGRVVWYRAVADSRLTMFPRVSRSGTHILWDATTYYVFGHGIEPSITRATLDLTREEETVIPGMGLTYDEMDDGGFLYDEAASGTEYHLARWRPDGTSERIWSCYPWMEQYTTQYWGCAPNTVLWDPDTDRVLWSMFQTSTVVEIDLNSGEMTRQFGQLPDGWAFDPSDVNLELQHYPNWTPDGTLILSTHIPGVPGQQIVRELDLDDATETVRQVWSYSPVEGHYAQYAGEAQRLANGNTLVMYGTAGVVQEVTPDGVVAWEADFYDKLMGHVTPLSDLYALNGSW